MPRETTTGSTPPGAPGAPGAAEREAARMREIHASIDHEPSGAEVMARLIRLERILEADAKKPIAELHDRAAAAAASAREQKGE